MGRRILVLLAALVLLAGCRGGSDPEVIADPTPSPTVSPVEESTSAAPVVETPEDYIRRWAKSEVDMQNSGDTREYRAVVAECTVCLRLADKVENYYSAGGFVESSGQKIQEIKLFASNDILSKFTVRLNAGPTRFKESASSGVENLEGGLTLYRLTLHKAANGWSLTDVEQLAS